MKIQLLKNAFKPDEARTRTILKKDSIVDVPAEEAEILIEKGYAAEIKPPKAEKKAEAKKEDSTPTK